eukprot:TRINITY_DN20649_c0_g1_i1.p1 TRINITY_DN20649_c0_g1~~TRINITY_DN20649_c0_g1_i1.p1  ORF type:complete len:335 (-),score=60.15 TRINITY_DN20649_c0_g1_i1:329-1333(-)
MKREADHYTVLGVSRHAPLKEIKQAFRSKALQYHPDKNPDGEQMFKKITEAYEILSNPTSRQRYNTETDPSPPTRTTSHPHFSSHTSYGSHMRPPSPPESSEPQGPYHYDQARARKYNADDVRTHDYEMAGKKGGFFRDFASWRKEQEDEIEAMMDNLAKQREEKERQMEAERVREKQKREKKLANIATEVLHEWKEEMKNWNPEKNLPTHVHTSNSTESSSVNSSFSTATSSTQKDNKADSEEQKKMADWAEKMLEETRQQRQQYKKQQQQRRGSAPPMSPSQSRPGSTLGFSLPTNAEIDVLSGDQLATLLDQLESKAAYIKRVQKARRSVG